MKKLLPLISMIVTFILFSGCIKEKTGPRKELKLFRKYLYSSPASKTPQIYTEYEYDSEGNNTFEYVYDYPEMLIVYREFEYQNGRKVREKVYDGVSDNLTLSTIYSYYYTSSNMLSKEDLHRVDGSLIYSTFYEYNQNNSLINTYKINDQLGIHHQYKRTYDNLERLILEETFMYNQVLEGFTEFFYDSRNRVVMEKRFNHKRELDRITKRIYEGVNIRPVKVEILNNIGEKMIEQEFEYDILGNEISCISNGCKLFHRVFLGSNIMQETRNSPNFGCTVSGHIKYEYRTF